MKASCGMLTDPTVFMRFLPAFCFSSSLRFAGDVATVAFCRDVFAYAFDRFTSDDLPADRRLQRDLELVAIDLFA